MDRAVKRGIVPAAVRQHRVFRETAPRIVGLALEYDIGTEREMVRHVAAVAVNGRSHLRHPGFFQRAAGRSWLADVGKLKPARRRKTEPIALRHEPRRIAYGRHLDPGLRAVHEAVEHLWIDRPAISDAQI